MISIYHNPDSSESMECLKILKKQNERLKIVKHTENPLTERKLKRIIKLLKIKPFQLIKTDHIIWKEHFQDLVNNENDFEDIEYIKMIAEFPNLMKTPIVIKGEKAILCKPPEKVFCLFSE